METQNNIMNIYDDFPVEINENSSTKDLLDYMMLVLVRSIDTNKAFKGGYLLSKILSGESRLTKDKDFSIMNKEYYEPIKEVLISIGEVFKIKGIVTDYKVKEEIKEFSSGGIKYYKDGKEVLGIDIGLHDILYGTQNYDLEFGSVQGFSVERMLADKLVAILSKKRFRRTKDLYDFYILVNHFNVDYNSLVYCINNRAGFNPELWENIPFKEEILVEYKKAWDKLVLTSSATGRPLNKPSFNDCISTYYSIALFIKSGNVANYWNADEKRWC